jgi:hypothetical protein
MLHGTSRIPTKAVHILFLPVIVHAISSVAVAQKSRFDPPFRNELHAPRSEDAGIVQTLQNLGKGLGAPRRFALVHGHFLDGGTDAVVLTVFRPVPGGASPVTFVFSKDDTGWKLRYRSESFYVAACLVVPASALKDLLLCQSNYGGEPETMEMDQSLRVFTRWISPRSPKTRGFYNQGYGDCWLPVSRVGEFEIGRF